MIAVLPIPLFPGIKRIKEVESILQVVSIVPGVRCTLLSLYSNDISTCFPGLKFQNYLEIKD